ncbi:hypothetical protein SAMN05444161_0989 [Rhizobiales bacterium GAS191]|nr:hypothetical protein SAMN05444161_0989 [Rhizobiales bacterium GAS191]
MERQRAPFSRLREKVVERSETGCGAVERFPGAPHPPSLRRVFLFKTCTFSRKREKVSCCLQSPCPGSGEK